MKLRNQLCIVEKTAHLCNSTYMVKTQNADRKEAAADKEQTNWGRSEAIRTQVNG